MKLRRPNTTPAAARAAFALYRETGAQARAHLAVRWWTAPLAAVEQRLPRSGRILEIGCGHGLFLAYAALASPERELVGTDIDADKIALAHQALAPLAPRVSPRHTASGTVPPGPFDAIVFLDVLYLLAPDAQQELLAECLRQLAPGGVLLIKEMSPTPAWKARWNAAQETLAVKVLRITEGHDLYFVPTATVCRWLEDAGATTEVVPLDQGYTHPHQLIVARLTEAGTAR